MAGFVKVGVVSDFPPGRGRAVDVGGARVAVFRTAEGFVAIGDACRHMGASLAEGKLEGGRVECGWHGWKYDVRTGASDRRSALGVAVYEVKVEGDEVFVREPEPPPAEAGPDEPWMSWTPPGE